MHIFTYNFISWRFSLFAKATGVAAGEVIQRLVRRTRYFGHADTNKVNDMGTEAYEHETIYFSSLSLVFAFIRLSYTSD